MDEFSRAFSSAVDLDATNNLSDFVCKHLKNCLNLFVQNRAVLVGALPSHTFWPWPHELLASLTNPVVTQEKACGSSCLNQSVIL